MPNDANQKFKSELENELREILKYWKYNTLDESNGGFYGRRNFKNKLIPKADKGIILNTRLLWAFSAAGKFNKDESLKVYADRAYEYLKDHFQDPSHNGLYWELDYTGKPKNTRKQIYAQAFGIYALSEYYRLRGKEEAKDWALSLFDLVETWARDQKNNGYLEAFKNDWSPIADVRLSEKEDNSAKTMNTHLHLLEAYTTLAQISKNTKVLEALENLIVLFLNRFYDETSQHFHLFFDENWHRTKAIVSYGHDIEAIWLLTEACKAVANPKLLLETKSISVAVAKTFLKQAYIPKSGIINEVDLDTGNVDTDRHWWAQMEALVGLQYAYEFSGDIQFRNAQLDIWNYTKKHFIDSKYGEWHFRLNENQEPYTTEDKVSMWKAPYHNSRACMVLIKLI